MDWIEQALVSLCQPSLTFYSDRIGTAQRAPFSDRRWRNATFMSVSPHCVGRAGNFFHIFFFFAFFCLSVFLFSWMLTVGDKAEGARGLHERCCILLLSIQPTPDNKLLP
jgi:hypothetical protein